MTHFITFHATHDGVDLALCSNNKLLATQHLSKFDASKQLIAALDTALSQHHLQLQSLSFIAASIGPAPFTTLRTVIATANGLHTATTIPLVGVDALEAFENEYQSRDWPTTIVLLNAFAKDVYFLISQPNKAIQKGCENIETFLNETLPTIPGIIRFIGNGVTIHEQLITQHQQVHLPQPMPQWCSLEQIVKTAFEKWNTNQWQHRPLQPLYLKKPIEINTTHAPGQ